MSRTRLSENMLADKVAIVTGASRKNGMGFASARALAECGAAVVITDLPEHQDEYDIGAGLGSVEALEIAVSELRSQGHTVEGLPLDLLDPDSIQRCADDTVRRLGGVDILVNNAGAFVGVKPLEELSSRDWEISWGVHVMGPQLLIKAVLPSMRERGGGAIVNISSNHGLGGFPMEVAYITTKAAMNALTRALAVDLGSDNIRVNAVAPGGVNTDISQTEFEIIAELEGVTPEEVAKMQAAGVALGRRCDPWEVGQFVAFLASPAASFISGAVLPIDGAEPRGV